MGIEKELSKWRRGHKIPYMQSKEDTEHVLECQTAETVYKITDDTLNQWAEVVKLYRQIKGIRK